MCRPMPSCSMWTGNTGCALADQLVLNPRDEQVEDGPRRPHIAIVLPVYKDWPSFAKLLEGLDRAAAAEAVELTVIAVNDCPGPAGELVRAAPWAAVRHLEILHLTRNLGHQRAIAVGLSHVEVSVRCDCVVVMDADGED